MNAKVDAYLNKTEVWREELEALRSILLDSPMVEELKWGKPCYTCDGGNVVILQGFKEFCAVLFPKGALLKDVAGILEKPGENTQAARRVPFTSAQQIADKKDLLKTYIQEAIEAEKAGLEVDFKSTSEYEVPVEFQHRLETDPALKKAYEALTPGRQRGYLLHFSSAKQSKTRESRIDKCRPIILEGKGLNDR